MMSPTKSQDKPEVNHVEQMDSNVNGTKDTEDVVSDIKNNDDMVRQAKEATDAEHKLTARTALRTHIKAILWSMIMSATIIMEGYDTILMTSFFAYPSFQKKYGVEVAPGEYELTGPWQSALGCGSSIGIIIALFFNGILVERFGHRKVILVNLVFMAGFIFITVFAKNVEMLFAGQVLNGFPWGFFTVIGLIYASEIAPLPLRGFLSAYVMMCWATGQLIAAGVLKGMLNNTTQWSYRLPFAIQWVWIPPIFVATVFCPDSPYWLVRCGRIDDAEKALKRLTSSSIHHEAKQRVNLMVYTTELEKDQENSLESRYKGWKSYIECFKGANARRTEIACVSIATQVLGGNNFVYSPSYFFSQVGVSSDLTYDLNVVITAIAWLGTFCSWFIAGRVGRRKIFVTGTFFMSLFLLLIAILQYPADSDPSYSWGQVGCVFGWVVTFVLTIAPIAYTITGESSSTRLRAQSIAIGRNAYNICQLAAQIVQPYLINPGEFNLKGRTGFVWFVTCSLAFIWAYFRLPEFKDRTYEELDILFERRVSARKFAKYKLDDHDVFE